MKQASRKDKKRVLEILTKTYDQVQGARWLVKDDHKKEKRLMALADYTFEKAHSRNGVFLSDDETGVALCYRNHTECNFFTDCWNEIKLMFRAFSIFRIPAIKARERYRQQIRPIGDYYYFWMLGVLEDGKGRGAARELKNAMFQMADAEGLPIYAETSMESNCRVYEWLGFELYHFWEVEQKDIRFWFMKREPSI